MKDILTVLAPMLSAHTATVQLTLSKHAEGCVSLVVMPVVVVDNNNDAAVTKLVAALSVPIKITGPLETLASELEAHVASYMPHRMTWEQQLDAIAASVESTTKKPAATTASASKPTKASSKSSAATAPNNAVESDNADEDTESDGAATESSGDNEQAAFEL